MFKNTGTSPTVHIAKAYLVHHKNYLKEPRLFASYHHLSRLFTTNPRFVALAVGFPLLSGLGTMAYPTYSVIGEVERIAFIH